MTDQQYRDALIAPLDTPARLRKAQQEYEQARALERLNEWLREHGATLFQPDDGRTKANV